MVYEDHMDVKEAQAFLEEFNTITEEKELYEVLEREFPEWVISFSDDYSDDYPVLRKNWHHLCKQIGVEPRGIALVRYLHPPTATHEHRFQEGETYVILDGVVNHLFALGYILRRIEEFRTCENCNRVRPNKKMWTFMHDRGIPSPDSYSKNCC